MRSGADTAELRQLAGEFVEAADAIRNELTQIDNSIRSAWWAGDVADRFRVGWAQRCASSLRALEDDLRQAASELRIQATEQESTSDGKSLRLPRARPIRLPEVQPWHPIVKVPIGSYDWSEILEDPYEWIKLIPTLNEVWDFRTPMYYSTMIGLTNIGMRFNRGTPAFDYFRSAKGGFTAQLRRTLGAGPGGSVKLTKGAPVLTALVNAPGLYITAQRFGLASDEFMVHGIEASLETAASVVPFGGLAYQAGDLIGDTLYHHTPLGDHMLNSHVATDLIEEAEGFTPLIDAALKRADFDEANRLVELQRQKAEQVQHETSGAKGLLNSLTSFF